MENDFLGNVYGYSKVKEELYLIRKWYWESDSLGDKKKLLPKGILFYGSPGEGKTHLAREFSKSFNYPIFIIEGNSEEIEDEIADTYEAARKEKNAIVIIDELDCLVEKDNIVTRLLQSQLDGYNTNGNILTLATANHFRDLPEALLREGRFDRKFRISHGDKNDFKKIIKGFSLNSNLNFTDDEIYELSEDLFHYSISTIRATFNSASLRYGDACTINDILNSVDFIETGFINKSISYELKKEHVVHEAGHALYLYFFSKTQQFQRIYFKDEGGVTVYKDLVDIQNEETLNDTIRASLAGIAAEMLILGKHTIGCSSDLNIARRFAFILLNQNGYKNIDYHASSNNFNDREDVSSYTSKIFDVRVAKYINRSYRYVKRQLRKHKKEILKLADYLLIKKTVKRGELITLLKGEKDAIKI